VKKQFAPVVLALAGACGGGDGTGPPVVPPVLPPATDISTMAVGEVRVFNPSDIPNGIDLPAGSGARDYVIIVGNTNPQHDVVANYVVKADRSAPGSFGIQRASDLPGQYSHQLDQVPLARTPQQAVENRMRGFERSGLTLRWSSGLRGSSRFSGRLSGQVSSASVPTLGSVISLNVPNAAPGKSLCDSFFKTQATVASVSKRAILAVDTLDGPPGNLFTQAVLDSITTEFDNATFPTDSSYFNNPTDIDGNQRIILRFTGHPARAEAHGPLADRRAPMAALAREAYSAQGWTNGIPEHRRHGCFGRRRGSAGEHRERPPRHRLARRHDARYERVRGAGRHVGQPLVLIHILRCRRSTLL